MYSELVARAEEFCPRAFQEAAGRHPLEGAKDAFEIGLRGHEDPSPATVEDGAQSFRHGLEIQHELGVLTDELAEFIHEKVQARARRLPRDILLYRLREALDRDAVVLADLPHQIGGFGLRHTEVCSVGFGEGGLPRRGEGLAVLVPGGSVHSQIGCLERAKVTAHVEVMLKTGDVPCLP